MKIAILTDNHAGIKNDVSWMLDYQEKFFSDVFFPHLKEHNISDIIHLGDLFDRRKFINFVTLHRTRKMFLDRITQERMHMDIIAGNHDVYYKDTNDVSALKEIVSFYPNINYVEKPLTIPFGDEKFLLIPWINQSNYAEIMDAVATSKASVLCGHLELAGIEMSRGQRSEHGMDATLFKKFREVWSGHFHTRSVNGNIKYLGCPMELTFADYGDPKGFHVYDTDTKDLTFVPNPHTLYEKIYYNDDNEELQKHFRHQDCSVYDGKIVKLFVVKKTKPAIFDHFLDRLYKQALIDLTVVEDLSEFHESSVDVSIEKVTTKELMDNYVDSVETDMDKPKLKNILNELYIEAIHTQSLTYNDNI